jgi:hypothetical protein
MNSDSNGVHHHAQIAQGSEADVTNSGSFDGEFQNLRVPNLPIVPIGT